MASSYKNDGNSGLVSLCQQLLTGRRLILASNRGPVEYRVDKDKNLRLSRGSGGVVTALSAVSKYVELTWIASTMGEGDRKVAAEQNGKFLVQLPDQHLYLRFVPSTRNVYHKYYNIFCNPTLWFLQHYMWNSPYSPNIDSNIHDAWENGYIPVNQAFANAIIDDAADDSTPPIIMLNDYHLYLAGGFIRQQLPSAIIQHFIHIPWPAPSYWQLFPNTMRKSILQSLCSVDIVGLQTLRDVHQFLDCCEAFLNGVRIDYEKHTVFHRGHLTRIMHYPVSVDVAALTRLAHSPRIQEYKEKLRPYFGEKTIVRVDRSEPSKNILRGLRSFDRLLEQYPEFRRRVNMVCFIVPSRSGIKQYQKYTQEIFDSIDTINSKYKSGEWQPIKVFFENNYIQAIAGMSMYDVLFVNPVIDGMNLVAKEGPIVNQKNGVLILSEAAGACEQLKRNVIPISPADILGTTQALYDALTMDEAEKEKRIESLRSTISSYDITRWLTEQFKDLQSLITQPSLPQLV